MTAYAIIEQSEAGTRPARIKADVGWVEATFSNREWAEVVLASLARVSLRWAACDEGVCAEVHDGEVFVRTSDGTRHYYVEKISDVSI